MDGGRRTRFGAAAFVAFLACISAANWLILHVGTVCVPDGPCLVPVAPGVMAPSGVLTVGVALVLRDVVQRCLGLRFGLLAIAIGTTLSVFVAPGSLVAASGIAFALSELADFAIYTPLQRKRLLAAVVVSSMVGLVVDSIVFLSLAFGSLAFLPGQIIGKAWAVLIAIPLVRLLRRVAPDAGVTVVSAADFDFELPTDRIAQTPVRPRDAARMLCVRRPFPQRHGPARPGHLSRHSAGTGGPDKPGHDDGGGASLEDHVVRDLPDLLRPGDVLVANDTRVIPAQLTAWRGEARIGITLDQPRADGTWHALARNARRLHNGDSLRFDGDLTATVAARDPDGGVTLRFNHSDDAFVTALREAGALALPPYIRRPNGPDAADQSDYQTIFAVHDGAVAAPTAGLHFTPPLLAALDARGIRRVTVTLHVGAGTFLPVRTGDVAQHHMHAERGMISGATAHAINEARAAGGRVVAVGTTSLRLLESSVTENGTITEFNGETSLFILPGYRFRAVDLLMTNFHLPRSTLFMLVCAFAGTETMRAAYAHAIAAGYRFYSYGDSSLLRRHDQ